MLEAIKQK